MPVARFFLSSILLVSTTMWAAVFYEFNASAGLPDSGLKGLVPKVIVKNRVFKGSQTIALPFWRDSIKTVSTIEKRIPFRQSNCIRFHFAFDPISILDTAVWAKQRTTFTIKFGSLVLDDSLSWDREQNLLNLCLTHNNGAWYFFYANFPPGKTGAEEKAFMPATPGVPYCFEIMLSSNSDTVSQSVELRVNGRTLMTFVTRELNFKVRKSYFLFGESYPKYICKQDFYLDHIALADTWLGDPPQPPSFGAFPYKSTFGTMETTLHSPPYRSFLVPSSHWATRYQIQSAGQSWELPLYDSGKDSLHLDSLVVQELPLNPDANYLWRVQHFDANGNSSDWSEPVPLNRATGSLSPGTLTLPVLRDVHFSAPGQSKSLAAVRAGEWVDLVFTVAAPRGWKDVSFALIWCNNAEYTLGTILNRGGIFFPENNYVFNFSLGDNPPLLFEKNIPGMSKPTQLPGNRPGLIMDPTPASYRIDTAHGQVRCRVRFLPQAKPGEWSLRGFVKNWGDSTGLLVYSTFKLEKAVEHARTSLAAKCAAGGLAAAILLVLAFLRLRRRRVHQSETGHAIEVPSREKEIVEKFTEYLRKNLAGPLASEEMETYMNMGYANLYRIVKKVTNQTIKDMIIQVRIEKARELLQTTTLNITEVMHESGFNDSAHFSTTFKKITGLSPRQYRDNLKK